MIEVKNLSKKYINEDNCAIDDISIDIKESGLVSIVGESGSGKTTFLNCLSGIDTPTNGSISGINKNDVAFIFQDYQLFDKMSVFDNLSFANSNEIEIKKALETVELSGIEKKRINELSGGQKQRVAIARALLQNTKFIFADEPTGNLDSKNSIIIAELLSKISKNKLVLIVTHNKELFMNFSDRIIEFKDGKINSDVTLNDTSYENEDNLLVTNKKINLKKILVLRKTTSRNNKSTKIFNILFSFLMLIISFLGLNIITNEKADVINVSSKNDKLQSICFYKKNTNPDVYSEKELILDDDLQLFDLSSGKYAIKYQGITDIVVGNDNTMDVSNIYVCEKASNTFLGEERLLDNEVILSYDCALEYGMAAGINIYSNATNKRDLSVLLNNKITVKGIQLTIIGIDKEQIKYDSKSEKYKEVLNYGSYLYCNSNTYKSILANDYKEKTLWINFETYKNTKEMTSFKKNITNEFYYGRKPIHNNEISLTKSIVEMIFGTNIYEECIGKTVTVSIANINKSICYSFDLVGVSLNNCFSDDFCYDAYFVSDSYGKIITNREIALIGKGITKANIRELLKRGYIDDTYLSFDNAEAYYSSRFIGTVLLFVLVPVGIILFVFQSINSKQKIFDYRRVIGVLKVLSYSNKEILKIFIIDAFIENFISFIIAIGCSYPAVKIINDFQIEKGFLAIQMTSYKPVYLFSIIGIVAIISIVSIIIVFNKIKKKMDVDLVYER